MSRLHIFNPEHELTLALPAGAYSPTRGIIAMRAARALLPAVYAAQGDAILLPEGMQLAGAESLPEHIIAREKGLKLVFAEMPLPGDITSVLPWGWDASIAKQLVARGVDSRLYPGADTLAGIRELAHRRTTIALHQHASRASSFPLTLPPKELHCIDEAMAWQEAHGCVVFKAPWSSSGRGVFRCEGRPDEKMQRTLRRIIAQQGSVMGEVYYPHSLDFATEWVMTDAGAEHVGLSLFDTTPQGGYLANSMAPQEELCRRISAVTGLDIEQAICAQREALEAVLQSRYRGPLGIDMFVADDGSVDLFVEINLRMTMGHVEILRGRDTRQIMKKYEQFKR